MPSLIDKLFLTSAIATLCFGITTLALYMLADATENAIFETLFAISFILLCICPIVAMILATVRIWV